MMSFPFPHFPFDPSIGIFKSRRSRAASSSLEPVSNRKSSSNEDYRGILRSGDAVWQFCLGDNKRSIDERGRGTRRLFEFGYVLLCGLLK
jgi:hypothetical protein